jgi:hypothetical protein
MKFRNSLPMEECVAFRVLGVEGGLGKVLGSELLWSCAPGDFSTLRDPDQDVSPLSEEAVQV